MTRRFRRWLIVAIAVLTAFLMWYGLRRHYPAPPRLPGTEREFKGLPGGGATIEAGQYILDQVQQGRLPGFAKGDHGSLVVPNIKPPQEQTEAYPVLRVICLRKEGDDSEYYYIVARLREGAPWRLQKAWRAAPGGQVREEYLVR
jgi:hypothetical protein